MIKPSLLAAPASVRALERGIDLLLELEKAGRPAGLTELARGANLPKTTAQRLLTVLERRGFVQKEHGRYQLGVGMIPLARGFLSGNSLTKAAQPVLQELALISEETASLFVRQGFDRVVALRVESPHTLRYAIGVGQRMPLHLGAAGRVLAAEMPPEELRTLFDQLGEIRLANGQLASKEELLARIDQVRRQGFAVSAEERQSGLVSVAAPICTPGRDTRAAIAVAGPIGRMGPAKVEQLTVDVRRAAQEIAERWGRG